MRLTTIGFMVLLFLAACTSDGAPTTPTSVPAATAVPSATATQTPGPTDTPTPTIVPVVVPSNYRVLFARDKHLWSVDLDGKNLQRITPDDLQEEGFGFSPIPLSSDTKYVGVYNSTRGTWLVRRDGKDNRQISRGFVYPHWSPDSQAITYTDARSIYVRSLNNWQRPRVIASGNYGGCSYPTWSPNSKWIAFASYQPLPGGQSGSIAKLFLSAPDGSRMQMLHQFGGGARDCWQFDIQWSSNGQYLLVSGSGLWRIQPPNNRRYDMQTFNTLLSPTTPYLFSDKGIFSLREQPAERKDITEQCRWTWGPESWAFDGTKVACNVSTSERESKRVS